MEKKDIKILGKKLISTKEEVSEAQSHLFQVASLILDEVLKNTDEEEEISCLNDENTDLFVNGVRIISLFNNGGVDMYYLNENLECDDIRNIDSIDEYFEVIYFLSKWLNED